MASGERRDVEADAGRRRGLKPTTARRSGASGSARTFAARRRSARSCPRSMASADPFRSPFSSAKATRRLPPPELEPNDAWFEAAEADPSRGARARSDVGADRRASRGACPPPALQPRITKDQGLEELADGGVLARDVGGEVSAAFLAARRFGRRRAFASQTFWWTIGGEGFPSLALSEVGLPPATRFADMLTGAFSDGDAVALGDAT